MRVSSEDPDPVNPERATAMLAFEATWFTEIGDKAELIRARFGCTETEYNLDIGRIIDDPTSMEIDPLVVRRLRRHRDRRRRAKLDGFAAAESR